MKARRLLLRLLKWTGITLLLLLIVLAITLRLRYGGGADYPDLSTAPAYGPEALETVATYDEPFGNLAVSPEGRLFFTVHPESRPTTHKVMEWKNGQAVPYPNAAMQSSHFVTVLGMFVDAQNRLWTLDHGNHGFDEVRLLAFDLRTNTIVHDHVLPGEVAQAGSFLNDLQVSDDGRYVYIADVSFWRKNPALVVYDTQTGQSRRWLEGHASVMAQDYVIRNPIKRMTFIMGLVALKPGVDGLVLNAAGDYLYYGAMTHEALFRIPTRVLQDFSATENAAAASVERIGKKPMSDGLSIDSLDNVYITDVEHGGIAMMRPNGELTTLIRDDRVRWADGCSFGPDGYLYFTDSAIPDQMLRSKSHIAAAGPYHLYRFKPAHAGIPGR